MAVDFPEFPNQPPSRTLTVTAVVSICVLLTLVSGVILIIALNQPPKQFVPETAVTIEPGTSVKEITATLEAVGVVRSATFLYLLTTLFYNPEDIKASTYIFEAPLTAREVAKRLVTGDFGNDLLRFTHFEGERATHVAARAAEVLENFDKKVFLDSAVPLEGKLYPETYFIPNDFSATELVDLMYSGFTTHIEPLLVNETSPLTPDEILVLASILEREANSPESMRVVSGILQRRLAEGMPLQADASIEYVLDKPLKELTPEDLRIDSPYNTYTNKGLPPTPIGNPGKEAVLAVLEPTETPHLFYITGNDGEFYYAETYEEHKQNIDRYLR
jgi:UPF0755 protein